VIWLISGLLSFINPHKGLRLKTNKGKKKWMERTPIMAAGITDHVWTLREFFLFKVELYKINEFK